MVAVFRARANQNLQAAAHVNPQRDSSSKLTSGSRSNRTTGTQIPFQAVLFEVMRILLKTFPILLIIVGASMLSERPAYAYADPGTGLLAIQAVGSVLVAAGWYLRRKLSFLLRPRASAKLQPELYPASNENEGSSLPSSDQPGQFGRAQPPAPNRSP